MYASPDPEKTFALLALLVAAPLFACAVAPTGKEESDVTKCKGAACKAEESEDETPKKAVPSAVATTTPDSGAPAAACADTAEPNNTALAATSMGELRVGAPKTLKGSVNAGDEDWYRISVMEDGDYFGNRGLDLRVAAPTGTKNVGVEVSVFYDCEATLNTSTCGAGTVDDTMKDAKGCRGDAELHLEATCGGLFDSQKGIAFVRVRKVGTDATCAPYTLDVKVED